MKFLIVFAALFAVAFAVGQQQAAEILRYENNNIGTPDGYNFAWQTSDGSSAQEQGVVKNIGTEQEANSVSGSYSYIGDDGVTYTVNYIADENGFQPQGAHLPVA